MNRKKVAILLPWLKMGGTNKIALNFMKELARYCDVTLILSQDCGELMGELPAQVHLIVDRMREFRDIFLDDLKHGRLISLARDIGYYGKIRTGRDSVDNYRYLVRRHPDVCDTVFDCAISYHGQSPERLLNLLYRIKSRKKVVWVHGEISFSHDKCRRLKKYYDRIDHFFFVSNPTRDSFARSIGVDAGKTTVYYNPMDKADILARAAEPFTPAFSPEYTNLLTVGRLSPEKGQDMIPAITRQLLDRGHRVRWYIVGDGDSRPQVEQLIREYGVRDQVILLGVQTNPYRYMRACDLYVQPSYTEGYSTTICEAGILGKAIIGTKPSGGIRDQITHGEDGLIVDATVDGLTDGIAGLLEDRRLRSRFEANILNKDFEGRGEIQKFLTYLQQT